MAAAIDNFPINNGTTYGEMYSPCYHVANVTPSDSVDLTNASRALAIGSAGAIKVTTLGGETLVIPTGVFSVGIMYPIRVTRVWSTSTGAGSIVVFW